MNGIEKWIEEMQTELAAVGIPLPDGGPRAGAHGELTAERLAFRRDVIIPIGVRFVEGQLDQLEAKRLVIHQIMDLLTLLRDMGGGDEAKPR